MALNLENSDKVVDGLVGVGCGFQKVKRLTGYLSGDYRRTFNNAKQAEVKDRVSHFSVNGTGMKPTSQEFARKAIEKEAGAESTSNVTEATPATE